MIVFYNPHVDDFFSAPPHYKLLKRRALKKYGYIFDGILKENKKINVYIDYSSSAYLHDRYFGRLPKVIRKAITSIEIKKWLKINDFKDKINFIDITEAKDLVLFAMSYKGARGPFSLRVDNLNRFKQVIFHLSHYFVATKEKANHIKQLADVWLCGDSDIGKNAYFQHYFSWYSKKILIIPFSIQPRFVRQKDFAKRNNYAITTGSFHNLYEEKPKSNYEDYLRFFDCSSYHPVRKLLYEKKDQLSGIIDVKISGYREVSKSSKLKKIFKLFFASQKKYFSFDIVSLYNDYKFAVIGEESVGFPAIGAFEAMACGCVLIAQKGYYEGLGLVEGEHFIAYDGTVENLCVVIRQLQKMEKEKLSDISLAGEYYCESLKPVLSYQRFIEQLKSLNEVV
ncbi:hypothetical protein L3V82_00710 [Thiotrichales bacterium 19S3-7]|nr:hypothetical protein [Thiotrichales bacterium 19S3-7]MCF6800683.1 hypothetical protein [Thiotrichales bacterium 19S3-11]